MEKILGVIVEVSKAEQYFTGHDIISQRKRIAEKKLNTAVEQTVQEISKEYEVEFSEWTTIEEKKSFTYFKKAVVKYYLC